MTTLITGGTKGIGLAIAEYVARPDQQLLLAYRSDEEAAAAASARLAVTGARVSTTRVNVGDVEDVGRLMETLPDDGEPLHIVHSAAMIYPTSLLAADIDRFGEAMQVNGLSLFYLVRKALPKLSRGSSIVLISSAGAKTASANYAALGVGKAMGESLMRYFVAELAPRGIRINAVAPGLVATTSVAGMVGGEEAAARVFERAARSNPSGRMSQDSDYASVVAFLLSPAAAFVQGQVIHANGGAYVAG